MKMHENYLNEFFKSKDNSKKIVNEVIGELNSGISNINNVVCKKYGSDELKHQICAYENLIKIEKKALSQFKNRFKECNSSKQCENIIYMNTIPIINIIKEIEEELPKLKKKLKDR